VSPSLRPPRAPDGASTMRVGQISVPKVGEEANGDRVIVRHDAGGDTLLGVIDALGHGPEADEVAQTAFDLLSTAPLDIGLGPLMERVHHRLRGSRGAAATLCILSRGQVSACGVGNVSRVQRFRVCDARVAPASRLIFFSDGIGPVVRLDELRKMAPQDACRVIQQKHRRSEDDATVLIADLG
jgi:negative regulator of sigma-B (phosphoserine phosphatase)